jgi:hypothetical protein
MRCCLSERYRLVHHWHDINAHLSLSDLCCITRTHGLVPRSSIYLGANDHIAEHELCPTAPVFATPSPSLVTMMTTKIHNARHGCFFLSYPVPRHGVSGIFTTFTVKIHGENKLIPWKCIALLCTHKHYTGLGSERTRRVRHVNLTFPLRFTLDPGATARLNGRKLRRSDGLCFL